MYVLLTSYIEITLINRKHILKSLCELNVKPSSFVSTGLYRCVRFPISTSAFFQHFENSTVTKTEFLQLHLYSHLKMFK